MNKKAGRRPAIKKALIDLLFLFVGCAVGTYSTMGILVPNGLSSGGITGIARILQKVLPVDFSIVYYAEALLVLLACFLLLGGKEARKILLLSVLYPAFLVFFEHVPIHGLLETKDLTLAAVYCGVFSGISNGCFFSRGYSSGGTDTIAKIIQKKLLPQMSLSKVLLGLDACIIIASGLFYGRNIALYALITTVISAKMTEAILYGFESRSVQVDVICEREPREELMRYIMEELHRGVTVKEITGGYTGTRRQLVTTLCSPRESVLIRRRVAELDPQAFLSITRLEGVWGKGPGFSELQDKEDA